MSLDPSRILAIGDGVNDICMLRRAGLSVAFRPSTPEVEAAASHVVHGSLEEILPLVESSKQADFAA